MEVFGDLRQSCFSCLEEKKPDCGRLDKLGSEKVEVTCVYTVLSESLRGEEKKVIIVERVIFLVELLLFHLFLDEEKTEYNYKQREKIKRI